MTTPLPITAFSGQNALGLTPEAMLENLRRGQPSLSPPSFSLPFTTLVGELPEPAPLPPDLHHATSRLTRLAAAGIQPILTNIESAVQRWGAQRVGIILGTSTAGMDATEQAYPALHAGKAPATPFSVWNNHAFHGLTEVIQTLTRASGPSYVISTACSSSAKSLASAARLIEAGVVDAVVAGGVDALCTFTLRGFHSLGILSESTCQPFSANRKGINIAEASAFLLLEREGAAEVGLLGTGESSDAHHMSAPHPEGDGARRAMEAALQNAGLNPDDIDAVNAHGTGTPLNDASESRAVHDVFGADTPMFSTKGLTGHTLGAAGATEALLSLLCITNNLIPASASCEPVDPDLVLAPTRAPQATPCRRVISNSLAFGGNNASVILGALP